MSTGAMQHENARHVTQPVLVVLRTLQKSAQAAAPTCTTPMKDSVSSATSMKCILLQWENAWKNAETGRDFQSQTVTMGI